jgi:hypothetical protein
MLCCAARSHTTLEESASILNDCHPPRDVTEVCCCVTKEMRDGFVPVSRVCVSNAMALDRTK